MTESKRNVKTIIASWFKTRPVTKAAWITAFATVVALFVNTCVIVQNSENIHATKSMVELMRQSNDISFRPFVQIEGLQVDQISAFEGTSNNAGFKGAKTAGYLIMLDRQTSDEYLLYNTRNLGKVPARNIRHSVEIYIPTSNIFAPIIESNHVTDSTSETLFPEQINTRKTRIGNGLILTPDSETKEIRLKPKITYSGRDIDPNVYFYHVVLAIGTAPNLSDLNSVGAGNVSIKESAEGIEKK